MIRVLLSFFVAWGILVSGKAFSEERSPNVILIIADDLGYGELSCQDPSTDVPTPHIDSIAKNGVRMTDGYVSAPFCAASRAGLITGKYQTRFGFEFNPIGARNEDPDAGLPKPEKTLADHLRDRAGYTTAMIGKWHLGGTAHYNPIRRGFDEFYGFLHEGHYFRPAPYEGMTTWLRRKMLPGGESGRWISEDGRLIYSTHMGHNEPDYDADNPIFRNGQPIEEPENLTDAFTREAVQFIERCGDERPFFLYLAYNAVHSPPPGRRRLHGEIRRYRRHAASNFCGHVRSIG
jgi:arylsulfatase A-like enzyme